MNKKDYKLKKKNNKKRKPKSIFLLHYLVFSDNFINNIYNLSKIYTLCNYEYSGYAVSERNSK
ncbi:MAG: hypothetical protein ACLS5Y_06845 [Clostridia bacterium]